MFWKKVPEPGQDIFALFKRGKLTIEGDLHLFMANLLHQGRWPHRGRRP